MTDQLQKKRMSKGCLVSLIVVGVIALMIIAASVTCWMKKDDLARFAVQAVLDNTKQMMIDEPIEGIDNEKFTVLSDAFVLKFTETELDYQMYGDFFQKIQTMPSDKKVDYKEAINLSKAMVEYFPELEEYLPITYNTDGLESPAEEDTTTEETTAE